MPLGLKLNNRILYSVVVGSLLLVLGTVIQLFVNIELLQAILFLPIFFVVGVVTANPRQGFLVSFLLSIVYYFISILLFWDLAELSILALILFIGMNSMFSGLFGSVGGFFGEVLKKRK